MVRTHRSRWLGTMLATLALVLGLGTATVGTPAQAAGGSSFQQCFPVYDRDTGQIVDWICVPIPVNIEFCEHCPDLAIGIEHLVDPPDWRYLEDLAAGLGLLADASLTGDPRLADRLRRQAHERFRAAAERLGDGTVQVGQVGLVDRERMRINPEPTPWLVAAGIDLAGGLTLLQRGLAEPDPDPWLDRGLLRFDAAFDALSGR